MMIQHIPCKQTLICHVAIKINLYFTLFAIRNLETHTNTQFQFTAVLALQRMPVEFQ